LSSSDDDGSESQRGRHFALLKELAALGYSDDDCRLALLSSGGLDYETAATWLIANAVPQLQTPPSFAMRRATQTQLCVAAGSQPPVFQLSESSASAAMSPSSQRRQTMLQSHGTSSPAASRSLPLASILHIPTSVQV
jgi:hypothetical protein